MNKTYCIINICMFLVCLIFGIINQNVTASIAWACAIMSQLTILFMLLNKEE